MKTHLRYDNQTRTESDQVVIDNLVRKGWEIYNPEPELVIPTIYTAEEWTDSQGYGGNRPTTLLYQKLRLDASAKSSPKLNAVQAWLDGMIANVVAPAASNWPAAPHSFEETLTETLTILNS
jgi:hypothetical protein